MSFRSALSNRGFRTLWLGQLASRVGDSVHEIALVWLTYEVTGSPTLLSLTFVASFLPTTLLSIPAGVVADRVNRRNVLVTSDLFRAVVVLAVPLVGRGPLLVPTVIAVAFVTGVADAFDGPARSAIVPNLVPDSDLDSANSLTKLTFSASQMLFAVGGAVVAVTGSFAAFYVDAGSFFLSALLVARVPGERGVPDRPDEGSDGRTTGWTPIGPILRRTASDVREVVGFIASHRVLGNLVVLAVALQFTIAPVNVAAPVFAPSLPFPGSLALGFLYTAFFTGMTGGSLLVGRRAEFVARHRGRLIVGGLVAFGVALVATVARDPVTLAGGIANLALFGVAGLCIAGVQIPSTTLRQTLVPDARRGRFSSVTGTLSQLAFVVGLGAAGPVIEGVGARATLAGVGGLAVLVGIAFATQPLARVSGDGGSLDAPPAD